MSHQTFLSTVPRAVVLIAGGGVTYHIGLTNETHRIVDIEHRQCQGHEAAYGDFVPS